LKVDKSSMLLYAVTDRMWLKNTSLASQVELAIKGGVTFVQLREKDISFDEFLSLAKEVKAVTDKYRIPFVINDNIEVALTCDANGVHVGQHDMEAAKVRAKIGENKILGVSVQTVEQAVTAEKNGADYLGVGSVFPTSTKLDADTVSFDTLKAICDSVSIPVVAIGGINRYNVFELAGSGVAGIAVVSAIFAQSDVQQASSELRKLSEEKVGKNENKGCDF
jgi:thiamine-phosphate pyrophosphorylase